MFEGVLGYLDAHHEKQKVSQGEVGSDKAL
jgi:hypothetical protein